MKVVWITRSDPVSPHSGDGLYSQGLIRGLAACGIAVRLVAYRAATSQDTLDKRLSDAPRRSRVLSLLTPQPSDAFRLQSPAMVDLIVDEINHEPDAVVIDYYAMGWCLRVIETALRKAKRRPVLVYVSHNHEQTVRWQVARAHAGNPLFGLTLRWDAAKAAALERRIAAAADLITATTDDDRTRFQVDYPGKDVVTLGPGYAGRDDSQKAVTAARDREVLLLGSLEWIAKKENTRRFLKAAAGPFARAGIRVLVAGRTDAAFAAELKAYSAFCSYLGYVEDASALMQRARIGVMQDEVGGGFKLRFLTYTFGGLPIAAIASQAAGVPPNMRQAMMLADTVGDLVRVIVNAIDDLDMLDRLRRDAAEAAKDQFAWADRGRLLQAGISRVIEARARP